MRKNIKKLAAVGLTAVLGAGLLAGCGGDGKSSGGSKDGKVELVMSVWDSDQQPVMEKMADLNGLGHTFDGRVKSEDVDGPLGVSVFNADLRIFEVDFFSVKRTMIFGFAAVQATKSGALRSTLRFKQIGVAKRRHGFTGFTGEPEK